VHCQWYQSKRLVAVAFRLVRLELSLGPLVQYNPSPWTVWDLFRPSVSNRPIEALESSRSSLDVRSVRNVVGIIGSIISKRSHIKDDEVPWLMMFARVRAQKCSGASSWPWMEPPSQRRRPDPNRGELGKLSASSRKTWTHDCAALLGLPFALGSDRRAISARDIIRLSDVYSAMPKGSNQKNARKGTRRAARSQFSDVPHQINRSTS
jgi:hypothetical protein